MGLRTVRAAALVPLAALIAAAGTAAAGAAGSPSAASGPARTAARGLAAPGARLWLSRLPGGGGRSAAVSPDGRTIYVTGTSDDGKLADNDFVTIACDAATGRRLWVARYNGPASGEDTVAAVAVSPDGRTVYVAGSSDGGATVFDYAVVAYAAATGQRRWVARYDGTGGGSQLAAGLAVAPSGAAVYVTGLSQSPPAVAAATVAFDAATGHQRWAALYRGPAGLGATAAAIAAGPKGGEVFVAGQSSSDYATVAYRASTGALVWARRYSRLRQGGDEASSVAVAPGGGRVFVTGSSYGGRTNADYATVAYRATTGKRLWVRRYNDANRIDRAAAVAVGSGGRAVFVTGLSYGRHTGGDYATVAYAAATGAPLWARRYNGPAGGFDQAFALAVSPGGQRAYVTGASTGPGTGRDFATIAYRAATGSRLWLRRYDGPGHGLDRAQSVAAGPGGRVFVTGTSAGPGGGQDFATIAYRG